MEPAKARLQRAGADLLDAARGELEERRGRLALGAAGLRAGSPRAEMERARGRLSAIGRELFGRAGAELSQRRARLDLAARSLETTSPFAVLERGYSITRDASGRAVRSAAELSEGAELETVLHSGRVGSKVTRVEPAEEEA